MNVALFIFIVAAGAFIICSIIAGALSFSSRRTQELKRMENESATTEYAAPEQDRNIVMVAGRRPDRHEYYIGILIALWFAGVGVMLVPIGTGALSTLADSTQKLMAFAMILGASLSLLGASLGPRNRGRQWSPKRWWFPGLREADAYGIGASGQIAIGVALGIFGWTVLANGSLVGTITGLMTPIISVCAFIFGRRLWEEHKRLNAEWWNLKRAADGEDAP